ncbi:MAG: hypothetical protein AB1651_10040 [Pseudomonadota bacterium]
MRIVLGIVVATGCTTALAQSADIHARISASPALSVMAPQGGPETPESALSIDLPLSVETNVGIDAGGLAGALPLPGLAGDDLPAGSPDLPVAVPDLLGGLPLPIPAELQDALATVLGALPVDGGAGGDGAGSPAGGVVAVLTDTLGPGASPADIASAVSGLLSGLPVDTGVVIGLVDQLGALLPVAVPTSAGGISDTLFAAVPPETQGVVALIPLGDAQAATGDVLVPVVNTVGGVVQPIIAQLSGEPGGDAALEPVSGEVAIGAALQLQALGLVGVDVGAGLDVGVNVTP